MARVWSRIIACLATVGVLVGVSLSIDVGAASAAPNITYSYLRYDGGKSVHLALYANGVYAGEATWNADPDGVNPGDALRVSDDTADGYGIEAFVDDANWDYVRYASTLGHASPYTTAWQTGNLTEGTYLNIRGCVGTSKYLTCVGYLDIWA